MQGAEALVPGREIFFMMLKSPLSLGISLVGVVVVLAGYKYRSRIAAGRNVSPRVVSAILALSLVVVLAAPLMAAVLTVSPSQEYGARLDGTRLIVYYYEDESVTYNICRVNVSLVSVDRALSLLKIRTLGTNDPSIGLYMGHYKMTDGRPALVIVLRDRSDKALIVDAGENASIIGVPGADNLYNAIIEAKARLCHGS